MGFIPPVLPELPGIRRGPLPLRILCPGGGPEQDLRLRMLRQERPEAPESLARGDVIAKDVARKGLRGKQQHRPFQAFQPLPELVQQDYVLLVLRHTAEFVVRVEIGLADDHLQRFSFLLIPASDHPGNGHGPQQGEEQAGNRRSARLGVPAGGKPPVGQGNHQAEDGQGDGPDPERTAQGTGVFIPLHQPGRSGEGVAQHQPRPGYLRHGQIVFFPGDPGRREEQVRYGTACAPLRPAEQPEDQRHLKGIRQGREDTAPDRRIAHPERRREIPRHECSVVPPPEMTDTLLRRHPFHAQQRHESEQCQPACPVHEERKTHQHHEGGRKGRHQETLLFH